MTDTPRRRFLPRPLHITRSLRAALGLLAAVLAVSGCAGRSQTADTVARAGGLTRIEVAAPPFRLTAYARLTAPQQPLTVYIEGDGYAWRSRSEPSQNPTPHDAVGLQLAAADPSPNVLYLARPCQFTTGDPACSPPYWTSRRYAEEVIASLSQAIDRLGGQRPLHLVGYSGGGAVAALIAARRSDVLSLRTLAGNLDHQAVNSHHGVSPMPASLNAIDVAASLSRLPQRHFTGDADTVVPPFIADRFVARLTDRRCAQVTRLAGVSHSDGWPAVWKQWVSDLPRCQGQP
ncbi:alpha/beta fold hydrolase [Novispirillum itersonii]|uniref:alpha/beta fold hydrolase n=1 Tax=Novispirillum itersonii TaxID=189 RepID=UPI000374E192|nr:alpha/beta hydrolase [Novispirillum itersonii]